MKIAIAGCAGRMGQMLVRQVLQSKGCELAGGFDQPGSAFIGKDIAAVAGLDPANMPISGDAKAVIASADALIDFTAPQATLQFAEQIAAAGKIHVIGTTGFNASQEAALKQFATQSRIIWSSNMSLGVNLLFHLTQQVAKALGEEYDIEIVEMHHKHKVDAPSGTALSLGKAAAQGRGVDFHEASVLSREGMTGARVTGSIGFATLRGGDVIGDHSVIFAGEGERIELTHKASSREIYARGAVRAALWAKDKKPGLYAMKDVLGL